jgi:thiol-disulfide isomerase/thioredoxin
MRVSPALSEAIRTAFAPRKLLRGRWVLSAAVFVHLVGASPTTSADTSAAAEGQPADAAMELPAKAEKPGWLGVGLEETKAPEQPPGKARVKHVFRGSPASAAGLERGDIVLEVAGVALTGGTKEMIARVQSHSEGQSVSVKVLRGTAERSFQVVLAAVPNKQGLAESELKGHPLPKLGLRDLNTGEPLDLASLKGEVVVLDVWATWCGPCRQSMPKMEELQKKYGARGLKVVGISDEERDVIQRFQRNRSVQFHALAFDPDHTVASELMVSSLPTYIVVDASGVVQNVLLGGAAAAELPAIVEPMLPR